MARSSAASRAVAEAVDEAHRLPVVVDGGALVVEEAGFEADPLHGLEVEVVLDLRRLFRPCHPKAVRGRERLLQRVEAPLELVPCAVKKTVTPTPGFAPSFFESGVAE